MTDPPQSRLRAGSIGRMLRFGMVGLSGVLVNQGLLMLLHGTFGAPLLLSSIIAIEVSILTNFLLNTSY
jgi:putative flippase GtrA